MSSGQHGNQASASAWTEPPWSGWIETTGDALLILEAARRGLIPRVTRRLVDSERKMITSGSVFVFDEDESGIKRWTDGFFWSPSRILGNFLLYRETDKRGSGHRGARSDSDGNEQLQYLEGVKVEGQPLSRARIEGHMGIVEKNRERTLMGSLTNSYKFKSDGLMKKTFSLTIGGVAQHLISYYKIEDVENGRLRSPSSLPELASLDISPEYLDKTHFRNPPKVEVGADGRPRYRGEADDIDTPAIRPLSTSIPLTEGRITSKRAKRYDPYGSPIVTKRSRKNAKLTPPELSPTSGSHSPDDSSPVSQQSPVFPDPAVSSVPPSATAPQAPYPPQYPPFYQVPPGYPMPPHIQLYPHGSYPPPLGSQQHPQQHPPPNMQYPYPGYPPPHAPIPTGDPTQAGQQPQQPPPGQQQPQAQPYYPYYPSAPPPHLNYAPYPPGPYPHYSPYPPQPQPPQPPPSQQPAAPTEPQGRTGPRGDA